MSPFGREHRAARKDIEIIPLQDNLTVLWPGTIRISKRILSGFK